MKYCKYCGGQIDSDSNFCTHCGQEIGCDTNLNQYCGKEVNNENSVHAGCNTKTCMSKNSWIIWGLYACWLVYAFCKTKWAGYRYDTITIGDDLSLVTYIDYGIRFAVILIYAFLPFAIYSVYLLGSKMDKYKFTSNKKVRICLVLLYCVCIIAALYDTKIGVGFDHMDALARVSLYLEQGYSPRAISTRIYWGYLDYRVEMEDVFMLYFYGLFPLILFFCIHYTYNWHKERKLKKKNHDRL